MNLILLYFASLAFVNEIIFFSAASIITVDEDAFRNVSELITSKGYPVENHIVQTADGYLLSLQRIPHGIKGPSSLKKPVVFLMHGVLADAGSYVWNFPNQSYGFILADNNYDVWIGNTRGNSYSRNHVRLSPNSDEFWDFSLDELIAYDMPAMIDYILNKTGEKQLSYIGHSQGNTIAFALLSRSPLYNKKINLLIALGPVIKLGYVQKGTRLAAFLGPLLQPIYKLLGLVEILPRSKILDIIKVIPCATPARFICAETMFLFFGRDTKHLNYTRIPTYLNNFPSGASTKSLIHFSQMVFSNKFQMYDYFLHNMEHYNQDTPPVYDVSKITTPIALMSGLNDPIATPEEINAIRPLLKSVVADYVVPAADFSHEDLLYAFDAYPLVIEKVLSLLQQYSNN